MIKPHKGICSHTGGTTGTPLEIYFTEVDFQRRMAMLDFYREKFGFRNGMRRATFSGRIIVPTRYKGKVFWRHNYFLQQKLYSTFHIKTDNIKYYVDDLDRFQPKMIDGFPYNPHKVVKSVADIKL